MLHGGLSLQNAAWRDSNHQTQKPKHQTTYSEDNIHSQNEHSTYDEKPRNSQHHSTNASFRRYNQKETWTTEQKNSR